MPTRKCKGHKTPDGKKNLKCEQRFWVEPKHYSRRLLCSSCQKLKNNVYHKNYLREWRDKKRGLPKKTK